MVNTLEWPANNPDLNPIKNVSNYMKNKTAGEQPTNVKLFYGRYQGRVDHWLFNRTLSVS